MKETRMIKEISFSAREDNIEDTIQPERNHSWTQDIISRQDDTRNQGSYPYRDDDSMQRFQANYILNEG
jgi:hypothetical protein